MDAETRRQLERYRDEAIRRCAQAQRVAELIITIAGELLEEADTAPGPVSHRKPHPHLRRVKGLVIGGAAAAVCRLIWGHRTVAALAALAGTALVMPLVAAPLIATAPASHPHARRRNPVPAPAVITPPARSPAAGRPPLPRRTGSGASATAPAPASSRAIVLSPVPLPSASASLPPQQPPRCAVNLLGWCLRL